MAIAVIDVGKTNAKVVLVSHEGEELAERRRPNTVRQGLPYPHFDAAGLWHFVLEALTAFAEDVETIVPVTHGACVALVRADGELALPVLDYEYDLPVGREGYAPAPFAETGSPALPGGLNVGVQLNWLERRFPRSFAQTAHILFWPQWWAFRLTGVLSAEKTSLGCHTDLWAPHESTSSTLARNRGWDRLLPPIRSADDRLGPIASDLARVTGLDPEVQVLTGLHDSNASLVPYLDRRPCAVLSTGTWIIAMALGGTVAALDAERDMLLNVAADGRPVPTARFMGGRERDEAIAGGRSPREADEAAALRSAHRLEEIGARGPVFVEGPFARSVAFVDRLRIELGREVIVAGSGTGTTRGAALLATRRS